MKCICIGERAAGDLVMGARRVPTHLPWPRALWNQTPWGGCSLQVDTCVLNVEFSSILLLNIMPNRRNKAPSTESTSRHITGLVFVIHGAFNITSFKMSPDLLFLPKFWKIQAFFLEGKIPCTEIIFSNVCLKIMANHGRKWCKNMYFLKVSPPDTQACLLVMLSHFCLNTSIPRRFIWDSAGYFKSDFSKFCQN